MYQFHQSYDRQASEKRIREVGIRKALGSPRSYLIGQFLAESMLMSCIAVLLAVGIVELLFHLFNDIMDKKLSIDLFTNLTSIPIFIILVIVVGVVAGGYPAFYVFLFTRYIYLNLKKG